MSGKPLRKVSIGNFSEMGVMVSYSQGAGPTRRFDMNPFPPEMGPQVHAALGELLASGAITPMVGRRITTDRHPELSRRPRHLLRVGQPRHAARRSFAACSRRIRCRDRCWGGRRTTAHRARPATIATTRPTVLCASVCSLIATLTSTFSDGDLAGYVAQHWTQMLVDSVVGIESFRIGIPHVSIHDVEYADLGLDAGAIAERYDIPLERAQT